jgi:DENN (AEX-3) domain
MCYHSFYWIQLLPDGRLDVTARIPSAVSDVDIVEQGLHIFISDVNDRGSLKKESCGNFVLTSSDGSRFYAFWCGLHSRVFVAVSRFPHFSFSRQLMVLLGTEAGSSIKAQLLTLCETPIMPSSGLTYVLQFDSGSAKLDFNSCEQINDCDVNMIPVSLFTPHMLTAAWESILLERKVLIISVSSSIISPSCEFLRRLMLPLNLVNTFVPLLPRQLINAIEAPFPYLCGAETQFVLESEANLSNIVLIDLDLRTVTMPEISSENPDVSVPNSLKVQLLKEITDIMVRPFTDWIDRPCTLMKGSSLSLPLVALRPSAEESQSLQADQIMRLFIKTNISLLTARDCTVKAFFRGAEIHRKEGSCHDVSRTRECKATEPYCFDLRCGVAYGCLQLLRDGKEDSTLHFLTCWVEFDDYSMAVYQHADQLPLLFINSSDIRCVCPSSVPPLGQVFEVEVCQLVRRTYNFVASDSQSRTSWMNFIESKRKKEKSDPTSPRFYDSSHFHTHNGGGNDPHSDVTGPTERTTPRSSGLNVSPPQTSRPSSRSSMTAPALASTSSSMMSAYEELFKIGYLRAAPQSASTLPLSFEVSKEDASAGDRESTAETSGSLSPRRPSDSKREPLDAVRFSLFRSYIMRTQMVASLRGQLTLDGFEPLLLHLRSSDKHSRAIDSPPLKSEGDGGSDRGTKGGKGPEKLLNCFINTTIGGLLWRGGTVLGLMERVGTEGEGRSEYKCVIEMLEEGELLNEIAAQKQSGAFLSTPTDSDNSADCSDDDDDSVSSSALDTPRGVSCASSSYYFLM